MQFEIIIISFACIPFIVSGFPTPPLLHPQTSTTTMATTTPPPSMSDHAIAFSAGLTHTQHISRRDRVIFDKLFVNNGNAYDKNSGIFICPIAGLYVFHMHTYDSNQDKAMWLELLHNNNVTISVSGYNSHSSGGNSVMLKLNKYDRIEVKGREQQEFSLFGLPDQIYSTLTGYLLVPIDTVMHDSGPVMIG